MPYWHQSISVHINTWGAGERAQCLQSKHQNPNLDPKAHTKLDAVAHFVIPGSYSETGGRGGRILRS